VLARRRVLIITGLAPRRGHRRDDFGLTLGLRVRRVDLLMRREPTIDQPLRWRAAGPPVRSITCWAIGAICAVSLPALPTSSPTMT
jgi:hypothetical protein